ncbi:MAG TPA: HD domain-containing phosphohydrolase [Actinomycetota bacterium]|nr:HD domain-containing phosphohydrolase [Actinomycetota bacterium]
MADHEGDIAVLIVDDEPSALRTLKRILAKTGHRIEAAHSTTEARAKLDSGSFALVLSDVNMPGESGMDLLESISGNGTDTATVMVTGVDDRDMAERALTMGAYGYVIKPFERNEILISVSNALRRRELEIENRHHREKLEQQVQQRTAHLWDALRDLERAQAEVRQSHEKTIAKLAMAAEYRDVETADHLHRMSRICGLLASKMGFDAERSHLVTLASVMHDVGKIGIPEGILLKPGRLDPEEFETIKTHAEIGFRILQDDSSPLLQLAATIALTHHEQWSGGGYPRALGGEDIPLEGRLAAVGDVFDALTSNRVYRRAFSLGQAMEVMREGRGTHFQPELVDLLLDSIDDVVALREAATS